MSKCRIYLTVKTVKVFLIANNTQVYNSASIFGLFPYNGCHYDARELNIFMTLDKHLEFTSLRDITIYTTVSKIRWDKVEFFGEEIWQHAVDEAEFCLLGSRPFTDCRTWLRIPNQLTPTVYSSALSMKIRTVLCDFHNLDPL